MSGSEEESAEVEHVPHNSADRDGIEYIDDRGIRVFDEDWTCPNCGDAGKLMFRPGSKNTCTECFWVVNGQYNDYVLDHWGLKYRHAQALLANRGDDWSGTPGSVATLLRQHFDRTEQAQQAWRDYSRNTAVADGGTTGATLGDFA